MYIEASSGVIDAKAWLGSELFDPMTQGCFEFWYHMLGAGIGQLNIYTNDLDAPLLSSLLTISGNQGDEWRLGQVDITNVQTFQILIEGIIGANYTSDVAVDDVILIRDSKCVRKLLSASFSDLLPQNVQISVVFIF